MVAPRRPALKSALAATSLLAAGKNQVKSLAQSLATRPMSKIGVPPGPIDRNKATVAAPAADTGKGDTRLTAYTYFTRAGDTDVLYNGDRLWTRVSVTLETAGPVAVGFASGLSPVTSGRGILLQTGRAVEFDVAKGNKLYILATGVNRVSVQIQSVPWLEQITGLLMKIAQGIQTIAGGTGTTP